jgi:hypothetical protein
VRNDFNPGAGFELPKVPELTRNDDVQLNMRDWLPGTSHCE